MTNASEMLTASIVKVMRLIDLMQEAVRTSETSLNYETTRCNIPEVILGGPVVSVLVIGLKVPRFKPG
jgi:hypothetical protein